MKKAKSALPVIRPQFAVAIFPCLKTSAPVRIGGFTFRSTTDVSGLPEEQASAVTELAEMLYARDDIRIASATYAIAEPLGVFRPGPIIQHLDRVRAVVGYIYSSPHPTSGDVFMPFEFASLAIVQPQNVTTFIVRPEHGTILPPAPKDFITQDWHTPGYEGVFNRSPLWLAKGSRIYGGHNHTMLNVAQDLQNEVENHRSEQTGVELLLDLLDRPLDTFSERIFIAVDWYNRSTQSYCEQSQNLLSLAIAFEVLLQLPSNDKTDRLADSIALLLGRTDRLKEWASQFYTARSQVAHEGRIRDVWFYAAKSGQKDMPFHRAGSVTSYGYSVFRLCLATILTGEKLAGQAGLAERFIANSERYLEISRRLAEASGSGVAALAAIEPIVDELNRFQYVSSSIPITDVIKALRAASAALSRCDLELTDEFESALTALKDAPKRDDFAAMTALDTLEKQFREADQATLGKPGLIVAKLFEIGWRALFITYDQMKNQRSAQGSGSVP